MTRSAPSAPSRVTRWRARRQVRRTYPHARRPGRAAARSCTRRRPCRLPRALADDRSRFADAKGLKAYAGAAPITRASGKTKSVTCRRVKNNRLASAGYSWALSALTASPGARARYDRRRDAGDRHAAAQRHLFGRLLGCLWHCLITGQDYDETTAFPAATNKLSRAA